MGIMFIDRKSTYPGRYKATKADGTSEYLTLERADVPTVEGTPLNAATLNGVLRGHTPRNLLDNSDFTNPVNQRGLASYNATGYSIDRWRIDSDKITLSIQNGYISMLSTVSSVNIRQVVANPEQLRGKTVTFAIKAGGKATVSLGTISGGVVKYHSSTKLGDIAIGTVAIPDDTTMLQFFIQCKDTAENQLYWAAIYEGEYTIDTVPEYQPKGYAAELLECQRYFLRLNDYVRYPVSRLYSGEIDFLCPLPIQMRVTPTISGQIYVYAGNKKQTEFTVIISGCGANALSFRAQKSNHGLTAADGLSAYPVGATLSADL